MNSRRKIYDTRRQKTIDFIIGFVGFFILNALMTLGFILASSGFVELTNVLDSTSIDQIYNAVGGIIGWVLVCAPWLINLGIPIWFAFRQYYIAIGYASAFGTFLFITICAGIVWTVACFVMLSQPGGLGY